MTFSYGKELLNLASRVKEHLLAWGYMGIAVYLGVIFLQHNGENKSWNCFRTSSVEQETWGTILSDLFFQWFGMGSYLLVIGIFFLGYKRYWLKKSLKIVSYKSAYYCYLCLFVTVMLFQPNHQEYANALVTLLYSHLPAVMVRVIWTICVITGLCLFLKPWNYLIFSIKRHPSEELKRPFTTAAPMETSPSIKKTLSTSIKAFLKEESPLQEIKREKREFSSKMSQDISSHQEDISRDISQEIMLSSTTSPKKDFQKWNHNPPQNKYPSHLTPLSLIPPLSFLREHQKEKKGVISEPPLSGLQAVLEDFGVRGEVLKANSGPIVTLYELEPAAGVKSSRVISLADDIARSMSVLSARVSVISGKNLIGIELSNVHRETVYLKDILAAIEYEHFHGSLPIALGKDIGGKPVVVDLTKMPHVLVAGTTGSGKSVGVNSMILSIIYKLSPKQCRFIMIDPKMLELSVYEGIPHLLAPVVTEPKKAILVLKWVVQEMENRYRLMSQLGVRNIAGYNQRVQEAEERGEPLHRQVQVGFDKEGKPLLEKQCLHAQFLPFIVVVVDEMADLMLVAGKELEVLIQRLAQMARAAGIHLIMATQRPSVDVITGTIKANFPTRISFQVTSKIDSRTILGEQGAEHLLGQGDMLYMAAGGRITRVHGPFVSDEEIEKVVIFLREQGTPEYIDMTLKDGGSSQEDSDSQGDDLYRQAVDIIRRDGKVSTSYIQRQLQIGYNRAATIIEQMEKDGIISAANHVGKREIL